MVGDDSRDSWCAIFEFIDEGFGAGTEIKFVPDGVISLQIMVLQDEIPDEAKKH